MENKMVKEFKEFKSIEGEFKILSINVSEKYIVVEGIYEDFLNKIYYREEQADLLTNINKTLNEIKKSVDDSSKIFFIKAIALEKNCETDTIMLDTIEEIKK